MKSFEENLSRLEELTANIRKQDISLEDALANFEEGIKLAKTLENGSSRNMARDEYYTKP